MCIESINWQNSHTKKKRKIVVTSINKIGLLIYSEMFTAQTQRSVHVIKTVKKNKMSDIVERKLLIFSTHVTQASLISKTVLKLS